MVKKNVRIRECSSCDHRLHCSRGSLRFPSFDPRRSRDSPPASSRFPAPELAGLSWSRSSPAMADPLPLAPRPPPQQLPRNSPMQPLQQHPFLSHLIPVTEDFDMDVQDHDRDQMREIASDDRGSPRPSQLEAYQSLSFRQRLQQHWLQIAGNVSVPDMWGREQHLKDWVAAGLLEDDLRPPGLMSARDALVNDSETRNHRRFAGQSKLLNVSLDVQAL